MSVRQFEEFQQKNTAFNHRRLQDRSQVDDSFVITIPLKESHNLKADSRRNFTLTEEFIKVIEHEYAVRYLEKTNT